MVIRHDNIKLVHNFSVEVDTMLKKKSEKVINRLKKKRKWRYVGFAPQRKKKKRALHWR